MLQQIIESPVKDRDDKYIYTGENLIPENARQFESPPWVKYQGAEVDVTPAPMAVFNDGYSRNFVLNSDTLHEFDETITTSTDNSTHDTNSSLTWACYENVRWSDFD